MTKVVKPFLKELVLVHALLELLKSFLGDGSLAITIREVKERWEAS